MRLNLFRAFDASALGSRLHRHYTSKSENKPFYHNEKDYKAFRANICILISFLTLCCPSHCLDHSDGERSIKVTRNGRPDTRRPVLHYQDALRAKILDNDSRSPPSQ